jgi:low temperature requirement protein LtrA
VTGPPEQAGQAERVSTLELFFDLVFVFTITQLTAVLSDDPTLRGLLRVALMLGVIFWMYGGYAWMTNAVATDRVARRLLLLGGMAGFLVLALAIPRAFTEGDVAFGVAYLVIVSIHTGLYSRTGVPNTVRALVRLAPFNLASALLVLAAVMVDGTAAYLLWGAAFVLEWFTPRLAGVGGFRIAPAHFVERHGLVVIVALGESIVAIGIGAAGLPVDLTLASVAVLGLLLAACLWWAYFGGDDARAERALDAVPDDRRGWVAVQAFGYWHLLMLGGIIALAAGLKDVVGHAFEPLDLAHALLLSGGAALFLAGDVLFCRTLDIGPDDLRPGPADRPGPVAVRVAAAGGEGGPVPGGAAAPVVVQALLASSWADATATGAPGVRGRSRLPLARGRHLPAGRPVRRRLRLRGHVAGGLP